MDGTFLYMYARCSTCRTADQMLGDSGIAYGKRDIFADPLTAAELSDLFSRIGRTASEMLSRRSIPFRELRLAERDLSDQELLDLMADHPALIRRPIVLIGGTAQVGLNKKNLESAIAAMNRNDE